MNDRFAVVVIFDLHAGAHEQFVSLVRDNARISVEREPDCHRFDVLLTDVPERVVLYEIYTNHRAFDFHLATDHFAGFDDATQPLVAAKTVMFGDALINTKVPV